MSRERAGKAKTPDFGKRGHVEVVQAIVRKPTSMERLKKIGSRWWSRKTTPKKAQAKSGARPGRT